MGKCVGAAFELVSMAMFSRFGTDSAKYTFFMALLPGVIYMSGDWFIFVINSHQAHLNVFKVMETNETPMEKEVSRQAAINFFGKSAAP